MATSCVKQEPRPSTPRCGGPAHGGSQHAPTGCHHATEGHPGTIHWPAGLGSSPELLHQPVGWAGLGWTRETPRLRQRNPTPEPQDTYLPIGIDQDGPAALASAPAVLALPHERRRGAGGHPCTSCPHLRTQEDLFINAGSSPGGICQQLVPYHNPPSMPQEFNPSSPTAFCPGTTVTTV